jgi:hypothetical protein
LNIASEGREKRSQLLFAHDTRTPKANRCVCASLRTRRKKEFSQEVHSPHAHELIECVSTSWGNASKVTMAANHEGSVRICKRRHMCDRVFPLLPLLRVIPLDRLVLRRRQFRR